MRSGLGESLQTGSRWDPGRFLPLSLVFLFFCTSMSYFVVMWAIWECFRHFFLPLFALSRRCAKAYNLPKKKYNNVCIVMVKEVWAKQHKEPQKRCGFKHESLCRHWAPATQRWLLVLLVIISNFPSIDFLSWATKEELPLTLLYFSTAIAPFSLFFTPTFFFACIPLRWDLSCAVKCFEILDASFCLSFALLLSLSPSPFCCFLPTTQVKAFLHLTIALLSPPRGWQRSI